MIHAILCMALVGAVQLPMGTAPEPLAFPHFPDPLHAYVWFNWELVPPGRLASVVGATEGQIRAIGYSMGLPEPKPVSEDQWRRSYITLIRRNWHLLPYEQLLALLDWTDEELAYCLREDDFLFTKLGNLKPNAPRLRYAPPGEAARKRAAEITAVVRAAFPEGLNRGEEPLFHFVRELSAPLPEKAAAPDRKESLFSPRYCSSYFMLYGDPFLEPQADAYPDGHLARLAESGVNGVWLQAVLYKMTHFPWDASLSRDWEKRLENLGRLVARAQNHGIGIYLYLNEPRAMPLEFFEGRPELKGVVEGTHAALCTSATPVREYLRQAVATICRAAPDLAGFFTISGSENLTNCWSHQGGAACSRCQERGPATVIAELHRAIRQGIADAGSTARLIVWDWGWPDEWAEGLIDRLPQDAALLSVSEWSLPLERGGIENVVGEYSISAIGPGPRATRHWGFAHRRGMKTLAKVQAGNTWELSAVPYIPAIENVARHAANLRGAGIDGLMLGWTLGGYPSPNLEVFAEMGKPGERSVEDAMRTVATRRYGPAAAPHVVAAWKAFSKAFREFPYHGDTLYTAPQQMGPANPLWPAPTGYRATMVGLPYDALDQWRGNYPPEVFAGQFEKMADGFDAALATLRAETAGIECTETQRRLLSEELNVAEACALHFRSVMNQCAFILARDAPARGEQSEATPERIAKLKGILESEIEVAKKLYALQRRDARIGFEASNHYFYVPLDLAAKVVNCQYLLDTWLPAEAARLRSPDFHSDR